MTRAHGVARLLLLAVLLSDAVLGQRRLSDVEVLVECAWPEIVDRGYLPARVELSNRSGQDRRVSISSNAGTWNLNLKTEQVLTVPPGESIRLELLLPTFLANHSPGSGGSTGLVIIVDGERDYFDLDPGTNNWAPNSRAVMFFGSLVPGSVEFAQLDKDLLAVDVPALLDPASTGRARDRAVDFSFSLGAAGFEAMPLSAMAYSSLDAVVLDARDRLPASEQLESLASWVRTGGSLVVFGGAAVRDTLASTPSFEGAFEERFEVAPDAGVWRFGFGRLAVQARGSFQDERGVAFLKDALLETREPDGRGAPWVPISNGPWRGMGDTLGAPDFGRLPIRVFLLLLLGFAVVIGPVNLFAIRRLARPGLLLITIPVLSILASVGVLAYGVLYQGLGTKALASTVSVLDQRVARVATVEHRHLFVGMSPGHGLQLAEGTSVFPRRIGEEEATFEIRQGSGVELGGDFLPVRTPVEQVLTSARAARLDLAFEKGADGTWTVTNRLETGVIELLLHDASGGLHLGGPIGAGRSVALEELPRTTAADMEAVEEARLRLTRRTLLRSPDLEPGSYLARIEENPFRDACELSIEDQGSIHVLKGILSLNEQEWSR